MDPFSISIGALSCINAAGKVYSKGQHTISELYYAPSIVNRIVEDVANFQAVVSSIRDALQNTASSAFISQDDQDRLLTFFEKAKEKLLQIEMILEYAMIDQQTNTQETKVSRLATIRKKEDVIQLQQEFKDLTDGIGKIWQAIIV